MATMTPLIIFLAIALLFYTGVALKKYIETDICTICLAISLSWIALLLARQLGVFDNTALLALLIGESVVGGYYLIERTVKKSLLVFRLPLLLTMTYLAFIIVSKDVYLEILLVLTPLWAIHGAMYYYRSRPNVRDKVNELIACCSRW